MIDTQGFWDGVRFHVGPVGQISCMVWSLLGLVTLAFFLRWFLDDHSWLMLLSHISFNWDDV